MEEGYNFGKYNIILKQNENLLSQIPALVLNSSLFYTFFKKMQIKKNHKNNPILNPFPKIKERGYVYTYFVAFLPNFREEIQRWVNFI